MRDSKVHNRRGSILLLVIGLLTILAMMGATFLFVARMSSRQSKALASTSQADHLASGIVKTVSKLLKDDVLYDPNTAVADDEIPYGSDSTTPGHIVNFVDCPGNENYLSSPAYTEHGTGVYLWNFLTNIHGGSTDSDFVNITTTMVPSAGSTSPEYVSVGGGLNDPDYIQNNIAGKTVDDEPRILDGLLYDTGTTTADGDKLYASVRVVDLGGLLCVNTAGKDAAAANLKTPVRIDLETFVSPGCYSLINGPSTDTTNPGRCDPTLTGETDYYNNCGLQLFAPKNGVYLPYAIGDEAFLRNLTPIKNNPSTLQGRLAGILRNGAGEVNLNYWRGFMTTYNCSRQVIRYPQAGVLEAPLYIGDTVDISDAAKQTALIEALLKGGAIAITEADVVQFVANLWASMTDSATAQGKAFKVQYPAAAPTTTAYGLVLQPVITEAFVLNRYATATKEADDGDPTTIENWISDNNAAWACAIELMNPSETEPINLTNYRLQVEYKDLSGTDVTSTIDLSTYGSLPKSSGVAGDNKLVIYNISNTAGATGTPQEITETTIGATGEWHKESLRFLNESGTTPVVVKLYRIGEVSPGVFENILLDKVTTDNLDCEVLETELNNPTAVDDTTGAPFNADEIIDIRRDDVIAHGHYAVQFHGPPNTSHMLLQDNGVTLPAGLSIPFDLNGIKHTIPNSVGDLADIYLVGPSDTKTTTTAFTEKFDQTETRAKVNFVSTAINSSNSYPSVPWTCILGEYFTLLSSDSTRTDEDRRVYGKVNINSATKTTLAALPWPADLKATDGLGLTQASKIADYIIAYRDGLSVAKPVKTPAWAPGTENRVYGDKDAVAPDRFTRDATELTALRADEEIGFMTPAELAIPLWNYTCDALGYADKAAFLLDTEYFELYDKLYRSVANLVTVNSDVYAVNIRVQVGAELDGDGNAESGKQWFYVAVIDRSNCKVATDQPAVLLFTQVK